MPASPLVTRRRLLIALVALALVAAAAIAVAALRPGAGPSVGATTSASPAASSGEGTEPGPGEPGEDDPADPSPSDDDPAEPAGQEPDGEPGPASPEPRETLEAAPFGAKATPTPGVTVTVPSVEEVTGQANVPGEVGGPALRFTVELRNGTGEPLDLRTVVVNAYYGEDRTPATPLLKPGGRAFEPEVEAGGTAGGRFVFAVPPELQDQVELEVDPGIGAPIVIFTGA